MGEEECDVSQRCVVYRIYEDGYKRCSILFSTTKATGYHGIPCKILSVRMTAGNLLFIVFSLAQKAENISEDWSEAELRYTLSLTK